MAGMRRGPRMLAVAVSMSVLWTTQAAAQDASPSPAPRITTSGPPDASASPGPGIAEVALCQMPELGERAGHGRPMFAGMAGADVGSGLGVDVAVDGGAAPTGSAGCRAPSQEVPDPLGGEGPRLMHVVPDAIGDGGLDIVGTSWTEVMLDRADVRRLRADERVVVAGRRNDVLKRGRYRLIDVELASEPATGDSVSIATDARGQPAKRTPSSVADPVAPLANIRDLYTLYREAGGARALASDLSTGEYYTGKQRFAALLAGLHALFLIPVKGLGADFRPVAFQAAGGAPDAAGLGAAPGFLSTSGLFGWIPDCIEQFLIHEPLVLEDVEVSFSTDWVTFCFTAGDDDLELLDEFLDDVGDDDGVARGRIRFTLVEGGEGGEQEMPLEVWTDGERVYMAFPIGLKAYGYHALRDVEVLPTDDPDLDDMFDEAGAAIGRWLNPTAFDATAGRLQGGGECSSRLPYAS